MLRLEKVILFYQHLSLKFITECIRWLISLKFLVCLQEYAEFHKTWSSKLTLISTETETANRTEPQYSQSEIGLNRFGILRFFGHPITYVDRYMNLNIGIWFWSIVFLLQLIKNAYWNLFCSYSVLFPLFPFLLRKKGSFQSTVFRGFVQENLFEFYFDVIWAVFTFDRTVRAKIHPCVICRYLLYLCNNSMPMLKDYLWQLQNG